MPHHDYDESLDELIGRAAEEYSERIARGEAVDLDEFVTRYPSAARQLRRILPVVAIARTESPSHDDSLLSHTMGDHGTATELGDFRLIRPIGRGGMGVVHEAEQISMGRRVALKLLPFASLLAPQRLARFQNEVRAAALLDHPNIVSVYAVGEERGVHYFAMQLVRGRSLAEVIDSLQLDCPPDQPIRQHATADPHESAHQLVPTISDSTDAKYFRQIANIGIQIALALQHAHDRGVVHRDIKPANVLIDSTGTVFVTDFGLAHMENQASITADGDLVGTLRYMSPEQASGDSRFIDFRTDIYSLGVTLYELAVLTPAFHGTSRPQLISQISSGSFTSPRSIRPCIPRDLETIILRAMAHAPHERYASAQEVVDDLRAFLDHRPVRASRPGVQERISKWLARHPGILATTVAVSLLLTTALGMVIVVVEYSKEQLEIANKRAETRAKEALNERDAKESLLFAADLKLASEALRDARAASARERLARHVPHAGDPDRRNFAWHYVWSELNRESLTVSWDEPLRDACFATGDNLIAVAHDSGKIRLWKRDTEELVATLVGHDDVVQRVEFSPDGKMLASASDDGTIGLWETSSGRLLRRVAGHAEGVVSLCWGADSTLYTAGDREVKQWRDPWQVPLATIGPLATTIVDFDVASDQSLLAIAGANPNSVYSGSVSLWHMPAGELLLEIPHRNKGTAIAFHPSGNKLAFGTQMGDLLLWDIATPDVPMAIAIGHTGVIYDVAFSPDGTTLASASKDMTVRLWNTANAELRQAYLSHGRRVLSVDYAADNATLLTASADGSCRFWDASATAYREQPFEYGVGNLNCPFNHEKRYFVMPTYGQSGIFYPDTEHWVSVPFAIWYNFYLSYATDQLVISSRDEGLFHATDDETYPLTRNNRATSDLDADGDLDAYAAFGATNTIVWQERDASGDLLPPKVRGSGVHPMTSTVADYNHDGHDDLVFINRWEEMIEVNRERQPYRDGQAGILIKGISNDGLFTFADFNRDERLDIVGINPESGVMTGYFHGVNDTVMPQFSRTDLGPRPVGTTDMLSGDFDRDGDVDIVTLISSTNKINCYANDGHGSFQLVQHLNATLPVWQLDLLPGGTDRAPELLAAGPEGVLRFAAESPCFSQKSSVIRDLSELTHFRPIRSNVAVYDIPSRKIVSHFHAHNNPQITAMTPQGDQIVTASSHPLICFWNRDGELTGWIHKNTTQVRKMRYTADGKTLCVANGDVLRVYDVKKLELLHECKGHENTIGAMVLSEDQRKIITASDDLSIRVWSLDTGRLLQTMVGHGTVPTYLAFTPDERLLASGDERGVIKLWDMETGSELLELTDFHHVVRGLAFTSPDVLTVIGSDLDPLTTRQTFIGHWRVRPEARSLRVGK